MNTQTISPEAICDPTRTALRAACARAGGQKSLAARIGTTQSMVWYWLARAKRGVPGEFVLAVEAATGVSRHLLRPDIYPAPDLGVAASADACIVEAP